MRFPSLRQRLAVSFAGIAAVAALAIGAVLVPLLAGHYATAERTYLDAAAERAVRDLSVVDWADTEALRRQVADLAIVTQARVAALDASGGLRAAAGPPAPGDATGGLQPLANPLGVALLGDSPDPASLPRSAEQVERPVMRSDPAGSTALGSVAISSAPAYEQVALRAAVEAWALASLFGVAAAAVAGWVASGRIVRPVRSLTEAADRMARGDLAARAELGGPEEAGQLAASFNAMADRVEDTVETLRRFVGDAAHEIGTPLTALEADLELLEARAPEADERRLAARALSQARRLERLAADLLRLSRLEGGAPSVLTPVDLAGLARQVADAFASRADQADLAVSVATPEGPVLVNGDGDRLRAALANLLDNAVKFTPSGGAIMVEVGSGDGEAWAAVRDTGVGIPADDLPRVFERFHRGANASGREGSGLGLAIVRATAQLHGGTVAASSDGTGTRIEIRLPLA